MLKSGLLLPLPTSVRRLFLFVVVGPEWNWRWRIEDTIGMEGECKDNIEAQARMEKKTFKKGKDDCANDSQSFAPPTPRRFWASRAAASASSPPSFRSVSGSPRTPSRCTPRRCRTVVSPPLLNASRSGTSCLTVLLCVGRAMVCCGSSWRAVLRVARLWFLESCGLLVPSL